MKLPRLVTVAKLAFLLTFAGHAVPSPFLTFTAQDGAAAAPPAKTQESRALDPTLQKIADYVNSNSQVQPILEELCNKIGPRLTGSTQCNKACEWAKAKFESFGLKATIEPWGEFPVGFDRGVLSGKLVSPISKNLEVGTSAWTVGTEGPTKGGCASMPASADVVTKNPEQFKNKWILRGSGGGGRNAPDPKIEETLKALRSAGVLGFIRNTGSDLIRTGGSYNIKWDSWQKTPSINLKVSQYTEIANLVKEGKDPILEFNIENKFVKGPIPVSNVYADIKGSELPDEYIIVGGHIDSWDGASGATDNGTGVATTLEAARILTSLGMKPKRTIRFMLWSGEEEGLLGSREWIKKHEDMLPKISAVFVHDEGTNYCGGLSVTKSLKELFEPAIGTLVNLDPKMPFEFREVRQLPMGIGSDHDSFLAVGVPGFFWVQDKGEVNYDRQHHTQYDHLDVVRHDYQRYSSIVIAYTSFTVANFKNMVPRDGVPARGANSQRKRLGIQQDENMKVLTLTEGGAAEKGGVKVGDQIIKLNDAKIANIDDLRVEIGKVGKTAKVTVLRDGKEVVLDVSWPQ